MCYAVPPDLYQGCFDAMTAKIVVALGLVAVVVVAVIVAGALAWRGAIPTPGPLAALLPGTARTPEYTARFYPPDTLAYAWFTLAPGQGQTDHMRDIWARFNELTAFRDIKNDWQRDFEEQTGIEFVADVMSWAGPEVAAGLLDFKSGLNAPVGAAVIGVRDREAADDFLEEWLDYLEDYENADFDYGSYLGVDIIVAEDDFQAYALADDWLVFATSESALEIMLDRIVGDTDASLATDDGFLAAQADLPGRRFASFYVDYQQTADLWDYFAASEFGTGSITTFGRQSPGWLAAAATWVERGIVLEAVTPLGIDYPLQIANLSDPASLLPDDTMAFLAGSFDPDINRWRDALAPYQLGDVLPDPDDLDEINAGLAAFRIMRPAARLPQARYDSSLVELLDLGLELVRDFTRIDLEDDLFAHLGGQAIFAISEFDFDAVASSPETVPIELVAMLSYRADGAAGLQNTMENIVDLIDEYQFLNAPGDRANIRAPNDAIVFPIPGAAYAPGYVLHDGYLTLGSTAQALEAIAARQQGAGATLSDDAEYRRAVSYLPGPRQFLGFVNLRRIIRQTDAAGLDIGYDQYRILQNGLGVAAIGSYWPHCQDYGDRDECPVADVGRHTLALTLFPE